MAAHLTFDFCCRLKVRMLSSQGGTWSPAGCMAAAGAPARWAGAAPARLASTQAGGPATWSCTCWKKVSETDTASLYGDVAQNQSRHS